MNDVRFRIASATILSLGAFASIQGAVAALVWWLIFTRRLKALPRWPVVAGFGGMIVVVAVVLKVTNGTGISYGMRMGSVFLIAMWLWSERKPGEFLSLGFWLFGNGSGFELGMIAELGMQAFDGLLRELDQLRTAWHLKGVRLETGHLTAAGAILVNGALIRAQDTADLLAVRGYRHVGTLCPVFRPGPGDICGFAAAIVAGVVAFIPVGEFFILPW